MSQSKSLDLREMVFISLFTALIIIGGYLSFPLPFSPVPLVLADFFAMLAGLLLRVSATIAVGLFLFLGALGLPVFAGGEAGLAVLIGPKGGFLIGYLACALVTGLISSAGRPSWLKNLGALIAGNVVLYGLGVPWLKWVLKITRSKSLLFGLFPFMIGMAVKIIAALALTRVLQPLLKSGPDSTIEMGE